MIILDDADLEIVASNTAWAAYLHQGPICMAAGRVLLQKNIVKQFVDIISRSRWVR
jgi:benzaldehyde dehydrogenase (NAD)